MNRKRIELVQGTLHTEPGLVQDVSVDHRRRNILVSEEFLNGPNIITVFE
jgi:hypothetical protein